MATKAEETAFYIHRPEADRLQLMWVEVRMEPTLTMDSPEVLFEFRDGRYVTPISGATWSPMGGL